MAYVPDWALNTMHQDLESKLKACSTLPSPPKVASELIQLAHDPEADIQAIAKILQMDPALSIKILRVANSPLYANRRNVETLAQATLIIGLNGILALALSFSLVKSFRGEKTNGLNYPQYWQRALIGASISRAIGEASSLVSLEELFTAALMQDIGMLALDRVLPKLYKHPTFNQTSHRHVIAYEQEHIGTTHAAVGGWLLGNWNLPERLQLAISASDDPERVPATDDRIHFIRCVALSGMIAELYLTHAKGQQVVDVSEKGKEWLGFTPETFTEILTKLKGLVSQSEDLFECKIQDNLSAETLLETAKEALLIRNMQAFKQVEALKHNTVILETRYHNLEESSRLDSLTGAYNRSYLDEVIETTFEAASMNTAPLSFLFVDLDHFKKVNDTYGHQHGDNILRAVAEILKAQTRNTDIVGRYGGEEFFVVMPGVNGPMAETVCNRINTAFRLHTHDVGPNQSLAVTVSLGIATLEDGHIFESAHEMIGAADQALYASKSQGRDRWTAYKTLPASHHRQSHSIK
ncbi:sensor domain-containing diguanylate cyclase [Nitrospira sp. M1]